ncbi:MAG: hypothetical protein MUF13_08615 [Akkermansiaceae bacterium]|nr:hypothetical protein [Akkermansiaceae bacterium]
MEALADKEQRSTKLFKRWIRFRDEVTRKTNLARSLKRPFVCTRDEVGRAEAFYHFSNATRLQFAQFIEANIWMLVALRHITISLPMSYKIDVHTLFREVRVVVIC